MATITKGKCFPRHAISLIIKLQHISTFDDKIEIINLKFVSLKSISIVFKIEITPIFMGLFAL